MTKFSIVIPLYNKERSIRKTIESCLLQTYAPSEIIVVDDGSTDKSVQTVLAIKSDIIKIIKKENGGVSSARNLGIEQASFDYVALLDGDDLLNPKYLEVIENLINNYPQCRVYSTAYGIKMGAVITAARIKFVPKIGILESYYKSCSKGDSPINSSAVVISKECFRSVGLFNTRYSMGEDLDMWCRLAKHFKIAYSSEILSYYSQDTENRISTGKVITKDLPFWGLLREIALSKSSDARYCSHWMTRSLQAVFADNIKNGGFSSVSFLMRSPELYRPSMMLLRVVKSILIRVLVCMKIKNLKT
jgi:glycosyltransferase involved in cell wall biosynthesis